MGEGPARSALYQTVGSTTIARKAVGFGQPVEWWLQSLEGVTENGTDDWLARCPAHDDHRPSLHLTLEHGNVLVHCFAGCSYLNIYNAVASKGLPRINGAVKPRLDRFEVVGRLSSGDPLDLWAERTMTPRAFWEELGVTQNTKTGRVEFNYSSIKNKKTRVPNPTDKAKKWGWSPDDPSFIPIWPEPVDGQSFEEIICVEGEGDCGTSRYHLQREDIFTLGSAGAKLTPKLVTGLRRLGVKTIHFLYDADTEGEKGATARVREAKEAGFEADVWSLRSLTRPLGLWEDEKDIVDLVRRVGPGGLAGALEELEEYREGLLSAPLAEEAATDGEAEWVVGTLLAKRALTFLRGFPKAGKSSFTFKLFKAMETGTDYLGFPVRQGSVLILTENNVPTLKAKIRDMMDGSAPNVHAILRHPVSFAKRKELAVLSWEELVLRAGREARDLGCSLLVIDTLIAWAHFEDSSSVEEGMAKLDPLMQTAIENDLAVLVIHHLNKSGGTLGTTAFDAGPDILLKLEGEGKSPRKLHIESRFTHPGHDPVDFVMNEDGELKVLQKEELDEFWGRVVECLPYNTEEAVTVKAILETLGVTGNYAENKIREALKKLSDEEGGPVHVLRSGTSYRYYRVASIKVTKHG